MRPYPGRNSPSGGCDGVDAASLDWFKIAEANFDGTLWPTQEVAATLDWDFTIPANIRPGYVCLGDRG